MLEQSLERFGIEAWTLGERRSALASDAVFPRQNWAVLADMGVLALPVPEDAGGSGARSPT